MSVWQAMWTNFIGQMSAKSAISSIATTALGLIVMLVLIALPVLFIVGGIAVGQKLLPWLIFLSILTFCFNVVILVPLAFIRAIRPWAGVGFVISSYVFGLTSWFMGLLWTWILWGGGAVFVGLCFLGVGVVPMAILATLFKGMWSALGVLVLAVVLTFGLRILGAFLVES